MECHGESPDRPIDPKPESTDDLATDHSRRIESKSDGHLPARTIPVHRLDRARDPLQHVQAGRPDVYGSPGRHLVRRRATPWYRVRLSPVHTAAVRSCFRSGVAQVPGSKRVFIGGGVESPAASIWRR